MPRTCIVCGHDLSDRRHWTCSRLCRELARLARRRRKQDRRSQAYRQRKAERKQERSRARRHADPAWQQWRAEVDARKALPEQRRRDRRKPRQCVGCGAEFIPGAKGRVARLCQECGRFDSVAAAQKHGAIEPRRERRRSEWSDPGFVRAFWRWKRRNDPQCYDRTNARNQDYADALRQLREAGWVVGFEIATDRADLPRLMRVQRIARRAVLAAATLAFRGKVVRVRPDGICILWPMTPEQRRARAIECRRARNKRSHDTRQRGIAIVRALQGLIGPLPGHKRCGRPVGSRVVDGVLQLPKTEGGEQTKCRA